ncbi:hypothetical protein SQ11_12995 [Nitrosospira sp. NpAV]|nr:hypothetical protein SQ11_12995 [Nitrosospira sp. NpAV]
MSRSIKENIAMLRILFAMSEHQPRDFYPNTESEKKCADPDVFGCEKHQYTPQNKQCDGQESFCARVSDHGCKETLQADNLIVDSNQENTSE